MASSLIEVPLDMTDEVALRATLLLIVEKLEVILGLRGEQLSNNTDVISYSQNIALANRIETENQASSLLRPQQPTVAAISSTADLATVISTVNELINKLESAKILI